MDGSELQEHAIRVAREFPFAEHCWPFGPEYDVFKVAGKVFMIVATVKRASSRQPEIRPGKIAVKSADLPRH